MAAAAAGWHAPDGHPDYTVLVVFESLLLDRFVMARHRERGWELPGGRVEQGESLDDAARREWAEECALPLARLEPLLLHRRPDGSRGHVFLGAVHAVPDGERRVETWRNENVEEKIEEVRAVRRLADVAPLAFPDDPYAALAQAVWARAASAPWVRKADEGEARFVARLSHHPEAHPQGHEVVPHPARFEPAS